MLKINKLYVSILLLVLLLSMYSKIVFNLYEDNTFLILLLLCILTLIIISSLLDINIPKVFCIVVLVSSILLPNTISNNPILGGDLARELFLSHGIQELHYAQALKTNDMIAFTGYVFLQAIFCSVTSMYIINSNNLLSLLIVILLSITSFMSFLSLSNNKMLSFIFSFIITSQYNVIYANQQGLRSMMWILLFMLYAIIITKRGLKNKVQLPIILLLMSLAVVYYTYAFIAVAYFPILAIVQYLNHKKINKITAIRGVMYSVSVISWNFLYSLYSYGIVSVIESFLLSFKELFKISKSEIIYVDLFEQTISWKILIYINIIYFSLILLVAILALYTIVNQKRIITLEEQDLIAFTLWGAFSLLPTLLNTSARLTIGINRALILALIASIPFIIQKISPFFSTEELSYKIKFKRLKFSLLLIFLLLISITLIANTGIFHVVLREDGLTYMDLKSRRYMAWSVPTADIIGYRWLMNMFSETTERIYLGNIYFDNRHYLYLSMLRLNLTIIDRSILLQQKWLSFTDYDKLQNGLLIITEANIKMNKMFLAGARLAVMKELNMYKLTDELNLLYNNAYFLIFNK